VTTGRIIVTGALRALEVVAAEEPIKAVMATDALEILNALVDSYSLERLTIYHTPATVLPLASGVVSYTWGTGGVIASERPLQLAKQAQLRQLMGGYEYEVEVIDQQAYGLLRSKTLPGQPSVVYYAPSFPLGELVVWPVPSTGWDLIVYPWRVLPRFVDLDTEVLLPPGYERFLRAGLACEVAGEYGQEPSGTLLAILAEAKGNIKRANAVVPEARLPEALRAIGRYRATGRAWRA